MEDCLGRIPFASLIGFTLIFTGSGIMCGSNFEAAKRLDVIFLDRFYPLNNITVMQSIAIIYCVLTMFFALTALVVGILTTGATRTKMYTDDKCIAVGRCSANSLIALAYLLVVAWVALLAGFALPVTLWVMVHVVCREETTYWRSISTNKDETMFTYVFNLTRYGLYRRPLDTSLYSEYINSPSAFTQLCSEIATIGPLFVSSLISSFLVLVGLNILIACLASARVRLKYFVELSSYRQLVSSGASYAGKLSNEHAMQPLLGHTQLPAQTTGVDHQACSMNNQMGSTSYAYAPETSYSPASMISGHMDNTSGQHHLQQYLYQHDTTHQSMGGGGYAMQHGINSTGYR